MKQFFECEKCGKRFVEKEECLKHEQKCFKEFPLKAIYLQNSLIQIDDKLEIRVLEYPKCYIEDERVYFYENSHYYSIPPSLSQLFLEKIKIYEDRDVYCIYTTNFSEEHEKECIDKLLNKRKEIFKEYLENYTKLCNKIIDGKEEFIIKRDKDAKYIASQEN